MSEKIESSGKIRAISAGHSGELDEMKALWVGTAGTASITDRTDEELDDFELVKGLNQIKIKKLRSLGTASGVYGLY